MNCQHSNPVCGNCGTQKTTSWFKETETSTTFICLDCHQAMQLTSYVTQSNFSINKRLWIRICVKCATAQARFSSTVNRVRHFFCYDCFNEIEDDKRNGSTRNSKCSDTNFGTQAAVLSSMKTESSTSEMAIAKKDTNIVKKKVSKSKCVWITKSRKNRRRNKRSEIQTVANLNESAQKMCCDVDASMNLEVLKLPDVAMTNVEPDEEIDPSQRKITCWFHPISAEKKKQNLEQSSQVETTAEQPIQCSETNSIKQHSELPRRSKRTRLTADKEIRENFKPEDITPSRKLRPPKIVEESLSATEKEPSTKKRKVKTSEKSIPTNESTVPSQYELENIAIKKFVEKLKIQIQQERLRSIQNNVYTVPSNNVHNAPSNNVYNVPSNNVDKAPSNYVSNAPSNNVDKAPSNNVYKAPSNYVHNAPSNYVYNTPSNNVSNAPSNNVYIAPSNYVFNEPSNKVSNAPSNTVYNKLSNNVYNVPSNKVDKTPSNYVYNEPSNNVSNAPSNNVYIAPSINVDKVPSNNVYNAPSNYLYNAPLNYVYHTPVNYVDKAPSNYIYNAPLNYVYHTPSNYVYNAPSRTTY